jgi:uncharacterized protein
MTSQGVERRDRRTARTAGLYVLLALGLSWLVWVPSLLLLPGDAFPLVVLGAFGPAVAAGVMVRRDGRRVRDWLRDIVVFRFPARWYGFALAVPLLIAVAQTVFAAGTGVPLAPGELPVRTGAFLISALAVFFIGGGQEEPGWRGYLLPLLQSRATPLTSSVVIGVVWALWHLPLFVLGFEGYSEVSVAVYLPTLIALSVVHTYLWNRTGSVIAAMVLHAGVNAARNLVLVDAAEAEAFGESLGAELAWAAAPVIVALTLIARAGRELGRSPGPEQPS